MSIKKKKDVKSKKPPKESTYKFDFSHRHDSDSTVMYPAGAKADNLLVKLPFPLTSLKPYLSQRTIYHHYNDHHLGYYKKIKAFCHVHKEFEKNSLEELISMDVNDPETKGAVVNATLLRNHNFYWQSMKPNGGVGAEEKSTLTKKVIESFGSVTQFKKKLVREPIDDGWGHYDEYSTPSYSA